MKDFTKVLHHTLLILLIIADIFAFLVLAAWYYFGFNVSWGLHGEALTWGCPVLAGLITICLFLVLTIKYRNFRFGLISLGIVVLVVSYSGVLKFCFDPLTLPKQDNTPEYVDSEENWITEVILENLFCNGTYTIVDPVTESYWIDDLDSTWLKARFVREISLSNFDYRLLDEFLEINQIPVQLSFSSSIPKGYWIDYNNDFQRYFDSNWGGGWWGKRIAHPLSIGMTQISRPVYDAATGYGVISVGTQYDWLTGSGDIILFKYENGNFIILGQVMIWIS